MVWFGDLYGESNNGQLFRKKLRIIFKRARSPKEQAERELALKQINEEIANFCLRRNNDIKDKSVKALVSTVTKLWERYNSYGEMKAQRTKDLVTFSVESIGLTLEIMVYSKYPKEETAHFEFKQNGKMYSGQFDARLAKELEADIKTFLLAHERKVRKL